MGRPLVEEVGREGDRRTNAPAEEIAHWTAQQLALDVQTGHFKGGVDTKDGARGADLSRQSVRVAPHDATQRLRGQREQLIGGEHVEAHRGLADDAKLLEETRVAAGLAQSRHAVTRLNLDDRTKRERLVHAHGGQERRVTQNKRGDGVGWYLVGVYYPLF